MALPHLHGIGAGQIGYGANIDYTSTPGYPGGRLIGFGEEGTSAIANRAHWALSENDNYLYSKISRDLAVPTGSSFTSSSQNAYHMTGSVFCGDATYPGTPGTYDADYAEGMLLLFTVLDDKYNELTDTEGNPVRVAVVRDTTNAIDRYKGGISPPGGYTGFITDPWITFRTVRPVTGVEVQNPYTIPTSQKVRIVHAVLSNLETMNTDALIRFHINSADEAPAGVVLQDGTRKMTGNLDLDSHDLLNVGDMSMDGDIDMQLHDIDNANDVASKTVTVSGAAGGATGVSATGGPTSGVGVVGTAGGGNGHGVEGYGEGSGAGVYGAGHSGTSAPGVTGLGGSTGGPGVYGSSAAGVGVEGHGGTSRAGVVGYGDGTVQGVYGKGGANGPGVLGEGGSVSGIGVAGVGGPGSDGVVGTGTSGGRGVFGTGSSVTGPGVLGQGGSSALVPANEFDGSVIGGKTLQFLITGNVTVNVTFSGGPKTIVQAIGEINTAAGHDICYQSLINGTPDVGGTYVAFCDGGTSPVYHGYLVAVYSGMTAWLDIGFTGAANLFDSGAPGGQFYGGANADGVEGHGVGYGYGVRAIGSEVGSALRADASAGWTGEFYNSAGSGVKATVTGSYGAGFTADGGSAIAGVRGVVSSSGGSGVLGQNYGTGPGVKGTAAASHGLWGEVTDGSNAGAFGKNAGAGPGVHGHNISSGIAVRGQANSGIGVKGESTSGDGVRGEVNHATAVGVAGANTGAGPDLSAQGADPHLDSKGGNPASSTPIKNTVMPANTIKAWAKIQCWGGGGAAVIKSGFNIESANINTKLLVVNFGEHFSGDDDYAVVATAQHAGNKPWLVAEVVKDDHVAIGCYETTGVQIDLNGSGILIHIICVGLQSA